MQAVRHQRLEGLGIFLAALYFYLALGHPLLRFFLLILTIDLSMAGYLANARLGAWVYNAGHSLFLPLALLVQSEVYGWPALTAFALIWLAHVGLDRALGYGLKLESGFRDTHLGRIGA